MRKLSNQSTEKICPLLGINEGVYEVCLEEKCALYILVGNNKGVCSILSLAVDLAAQNQD